MSSADSLATAAAPPGPALRLRPRHVLLYRLSDSLSGTLILALCLFSPWAFGTTENWSTWVMNLGSYALGCLWLIKLYLRRVRGYPAARWTDEQHSIRSHKQGDRPSFTRTSDSLSRLLPSALFALTCAILIFTLLSAANARATYDPPSFSFIYHQSISWLPSSLDRTSTWFAFWQYLGLAAFFWGLRDWLLGKSGGEQRATRFSVSDSRGSVTSPALHEIQPATTARSNQQRSMVRLHTALDQPPSAPLLPTRLRAILWVLCVNGAVLGIEGILQRLEGSGRLLFLIKPVVNPGAESQFGPWAYRANAAAYFNLLWPVCLGFWWTLHRSSRSRRFTHHLLLACAAVMAACPIISTSRGGAVISMALAVAVALFLGFAHLLFNVPRDWTFARWLTALILVGVFLTGGIWLGFRLGWASLAPRMEEFEVGLESREQLFNTARPMASDYPWYGTGPGTFGWVYQMYRGASDAFWPAQLHNDWLETRITFGRIGTSLLSAAIILVLARWFLPGGIHGGRRLVTLMWLGMAGALLHARWDFPFQIHSIVLLFVIWCSLLVCLSRRP